MAKGLADQVADELLRTTRASVAVCLQMFSVFGCARESFGNSLVWRGAYLSNPALCRQFIKSCARSLDRLSK